MEKYFFSLFLIIISFQLAISQTTVTGVVTDNQGVPISGVNILVVDSNRGVATDFDGKYEIQIQPNDLALQFSYVSFDVKEVLIDDQKIINITLQPSENSLEQIIVIGYGNQRKSDITGSVSSLDTQVLEDRPQVNIQQAIQGALPGVNISVNSNTASGSSNNINIRGRRSISGGSGPLIVLDNVIFSGTLTEININDIANIEVLKDASSAAIYGARGANGVILLTTKKGVKGAKPRLNFSTYYGQDIAYDLPDMMDGETFYQRKVERFGEEFLTDTERDVYANGAGVNWVDLALRDGTRVEHNLSISGGSESVSYFISGNFQDIQGVAVSDNFSKVNFRTNLEVDINDWLKMGTNTLIGFSNSSGNSASFTEAFFMNPLTVPYDEDGNLTKRPWPEDTGFSNPLENTLYDNVDKSNSIITNNYLLFEIPYVKGLSYKLNTGYTLRNSKDQTYRGLNTLSGSELNGYALQDISETKDWLVENILNYQNSFGKHDVFVTALFSAQEKLVQSSYVRGSGFPNDIRGFHQINDAEILVSTTGGNDDPGIYVGENYLSQMLRLNYNFASKYLLTATVRRDGYSGFGSDRKYGVFKSVALGWNIHKESFLENNDVLNELKLRLSYGENGNQALSAYSTLGGLEDQDYIDESGNNLNGYRPERLANNSVGWETTTSYNVGVDFGIFKSRIEGSIEVYASETEDLLLRPRIPSVNGDNFIIQNIGSTISNGVEIALNIRNIVTNDFTWNTQIAFTRNVVEIADVGQKNEQGEFVDDIGSEWFIGQPVDVNFDYVQNGVWQLDEVDEVDLNDWAVNQAGDVKYLDVNGDGIINEKDRTVIGSLQPDFTMGINNSFTYKNFSLDVFFYWLNGVTKRNTLITTNDFNLRRRIYNVNYWSPTNPTNDFPENADRTTNPLSAGWYDDASFLRLKDVTLAYRLPMDLMSKIGIDRVEIFMNAKNLFTVTDWKGIDPESNRQTDRPFARTYIFGVRVSL